MLLRLKDSLPDGGRPLQGGWTQTRLLLSSWHPQPQLDMHVRHILHLWREEVRTEYLARLSSKT